MLGNGLIHPPTGKCIVTLTDPRIAVIASNMEICLGPLHLNVVCAHCNQTPVGRNAPTDGTWKLECGCTVRTMDNPKPQRLIGVN